MSTPELSRIGRTSAPLRRAFVERAGEGRSPLATLLSGEEGAGGGRGGKMRIALLVTLIWVAAAPPHTTNRVARYWASLLGLEDPQENGARAVRDALHQLADRGFIRMKPVEGGNTEIRLLSELGNGEPYTIPDPERSDFYFRVPRTLWDTGLIRELSGRGLAVYLIVLSNSGWGEREFWINQSLFRERYGLGETTRKKGLKELVDFGVLDVVSIARETNGVGTRTFVRNIYSLRPEYRISGGVSMQPSVPGEESRS